MRRWTRILSALVAGTLLNACTAQMQEGSTQDAERVASESTELKHVSAEALRSDDPLIAAGLEPCGPGFEELCQYTYTEKKLRDNKLTSYLFDGQRCSVASDSCKFGYFAPLRFVATGTRDRERAVIRVDAIAAVKAPRGTRVTEVVFSQLELVLDRGQATGTVSSPYSDSTSAYSLPYEPELEDMCEAMALALAVFLGAEATIAAMVNGLLAAGQLAAAGGSAALAEALLSLAVALEGAPVLVAGLAIAVAAGVLFLVFDQLCSLLTEPPVAPPPATTPPIVGSPPRILPAPTTPNTCIAGAVSMMRSYQTPEWDCAVETTYMCTGDRLMDGSGACECYRIASHEVCVGR